MATLFPRALALALSTSTSRRRPPSLARALFSSFSSSAAAASAADTPAPSSSSSSSSSPPNPKQSIAFIGLGNMGLPMAVNLLRKGSYASIVAVDVSDDSVKQLEAEATAAAYSSSSCRIVRAPTPRAALEHHPDVSAVVTMLPATRHAREVYEDEKIGVLAGLERREKRQQQPAVLLCDCSTVAPSFAAALALQVQPPHLLVDAPVSGGVPAARAGTLTFMVGGADAAFSAAQPLLALMGARTVRCGSKNGAGLAAKVANNLALAVQYAGVCEALALGQKCGVDPLLLSNEVFAASSADCWAVRKYSPVAGASGGASPASRGYKAGFGAPLMVKDLELALELAEEVGVPAPLAEAAKRLYEKVVEAALERGEDPRAVDFSRVFVDVYGGGNGSGGVTIQ